MSKFKKGDRVRRTVDSHNNLRVGELYTVEEDKGGGLRIKESDDAEYTYMTSHFELVTETTYQKLTPKVGDRFRVVKTLYGYISGQKYPDVKGTVTIRKIENDGTFKVKEQDGTQYYSSACLTTEYLEPVGESLTVSNANVKDVVADAMKTISCAAHDIKFTARTLTPEQIQQMYCPELSIYKQTLIQKTMNAFKKALLSSDTKTLIKAGFMDEETLALTSKGKMALDFISFEKYKKELVEAAKETIKEEAAE